MILHNDPLLVYSNTDENIVNRSDIFSTQINTLIKEMLTKNPYERITTAEALQLVQLYVTEETVSTSVSVEPESCI